MERRPAWPAMLELLKPVTWFPPMWAFLCGIVSSGVAPGGHWPLILCGVLLAGPLICGTSQAVNDWFDRHVDAINEPRRPIPSGRMPGHWGLYIAVAWTAVSLLVAASLGRWVFAASLLGMALAWAYSAPPLRLKRNGWWGNSAVAICYEGVPWLTAAVVMTGVLPRAEIVWLALLYSVGAHGIMTLNDFKSVQGDRRMGVGSLPVRLGVENAARVACGVMVAAQVAVALLLFAWARPMHALLIVALLLGQMLMMGRLLRRPAELDVWYNALGVPLYVLGMMVSALAVRVLP
ncbi:MAG: chlorophyll synthase ChlG [Gammaproteobacteria bacterium]|nr:chlorophyll synthase ChlG [Gammaproteobacteria bacterium]